MKKTLVHSKCLTGLPLLQQQSGSEKSGGTAFSIKTRVKGCILRFPTLVRSHSGVFYYARDAFQLSRLLVVNRVSENARLLIECHPCNYTLTHMRIHTRVHDAFYWLLMVILHFSLKKQCATITVVPSLWTILTLC